jgi:heat shock protein HtpX
LLRLHVDELFSMRAVCRELTTLTGLPAMNIKRVVLFLATNLAVMLVLSLVASLLGFGRHGGLGSLLGLAMVMGFGGAFISLFMSKMMAKWSTGAEIIDQPRNQTEAWLVDTVARHAQRAGIPMPEVAIYEGEPVDTATSELLRDGPVAKALGSPS